MFGKMNSNMFNSPYPHLYSPMPLPTVPTRELPRPRDRLEKYPIINLSCECIAPSIFKISTTLQNALRPVQEGALKRIVRTYFDSGFTEAFQVVVEKCRVPENTYIATVSVYVYKFLNFIKQIKQTLCPGLAEQPFPSLPNSAEAMSWPCSYIRCIAWHPNCFKIAVSARNDMIYVYTDESLTLPAIKSHTQKNITCMAWRPYSGGDLAVGSETGVCIWTIESIAHHLRPSNHETVLDDTIESAVTSLAWNTFGTLLAVSNLNECNITIWLVDGFESTVLRAVGGNVSFIKWSPDGKYLFSGTVGHVFRVWMAYKKFVGERWTCGNGAVQSVTWSPCGSIMLFVTTANSLLYHLPLFEDTFLETDSALKRASPIADLSQVIINNQAIGGTPRTIEWDSNGRFLAVTFKNSNCVVIYSTYLNQFDLVLAPYGYLFGECPDFPSHISFQPKTVKNSNSVLTIGWSNGRVQYYPFLDA